MLPNFNNYGNCYELYSSSSDILKYWKLKGIILKQYEPHSNTSYHCLNFDGVSMICMPIQEKFRLQIINPLLLFQFMLIIDKSLSIEISIRDHYDTKRRIIITSTIQKPQITTYNAKIPILNYPINIWSNLLIDFNKLTEQCFEMQNFKCIDSIKISGSLKIRKIYSVASKDEYILKSIDMGKDVSIANFFLYDYKISYVIFNELKIGHQKTNYDFNNNYSDKKPPSTEIYKNKFNPKKNRKKNMSNSPYIKEILSNNKNNYSDIIIKENQSKSQFNSLSKKTKDNLRFANRIPDLNRIKNQINYILCRYENQKLNINKILGLDDNISDVSSSDINKNNNINSNKNLISSPKRNLNKRKNFEKCLYINKASKFNNYKTKCKNKADKNNKKYNTSNNSNSKDESKNYTNGNNYNHSKYTNIDYNNLDANDIINENEKKNPEINNKNENIENIVYPNDTIYNDNNNNVNNNGKNICIKEGISENISPFGFVVPNAAKFENITLNTSKSQKNTKKNNNKNDNYNKYNNFYDNLFDSNIYNNNYNNQAQLYDSIEEVADYNFENNNLNNVMSSKMCDKLIEIDPHVSIKKNNLNESGMDFPEISSLLNSQKYNRPYTPPIAGLVPVEQNINKDTLKKAINETDYKNQQLISGKMIIGDYENYENLIYDNKKELYYDQKNKIYYDIKNINNY